LRKEVEYTEPVNQDIAPKGKVVIAVHLSDSQKLMLEELISDWGVDMAQVGRRLIRHLLENKITLLELLQKYQAEIAAKSIVNRQPETRTYRICIRMPHEEKQKLNELANEWFYLPGELARILFELFIMGIIKKNDIWI